MPRIHLIFDDGGEEGPYTIEDLRDRLDLRMIRTDQPCRIAGEPGTYVAGELVSGSLFHDIVGDDEDDEILSSASSGWHEETEAWQPGVRPPQAQHPGPPPQCRPSEEPSPPVWQAGEADQVHSPESPDEASDAPLWQARPAWSRRMRPLKLGILLLALAFAAAPLSWSGWVAASLASLSCFFLACSILRRGRFIYRVHPNRVSITRQAWRTKHLEIPLRRIDAVNHKRSGPGALFGRGTLVIEYHDTDGTPRLIRWREIKHPRKVRDLIRNLGYSDGDEI